MMFIAFALVLNFLAGAYVDSHANGRTTDIVLDNIPTVDLLWLYIYGFAIIMLVLVLYPLFYETKNFHLVLIHLGLLIILRSFFITLTHLQAPITSVTAPMNGIFFFGNDMFFSGHTAIPFLGFLLYYKTKLKWFFVASTVVMVSTVFLLHFHYTVDVVAAFFMTYCSWEFGKYITRTYRFGDVS